MKMKIFIAKAIGTSFGTGFLPIMPGTYGAIFGVIAYYGLHFLVPDQLNMVLLALILVFTILGTWACHQVMDEWGHDPSKIVMDETVGVWIALLFVPFNHWYILLGLVLFRIFDIWKPLGIGHIDDNMKGAFSVMLDDILAGVYSAIVLQGVIYFS